MPVLNPDHFFDQADKLVVSTQAGPPRQVDLRRAISSAYYGLFHLTLTALADEFVGATRRSIPRYALVYRSVNHGPLKDLCNVVLKQPVSPKYFPYVSSGTFDADLRAFAMAVVEMQEKRHRADYNPEPRFKASDAQLAIDTARSAARRFTCVNADDKKAFLTLLLCPPR